MDGIPSQPVQTTINTLLVLSWILSTLEQFQGKNFLPTETTWEVKNIPPV